MSKDYYPQEPIKSTCLRVIWYVECLLLRFFYLRLKLLLRFFFFFFFFFSVSLHVFVNKNDKNFFSHLTHMSQLTL